MKWIKKMLGWLLGAWGLVRGGVDLLESIKATHEYAALLYSNRYLAVALFSFRNLTVTVIVVGGGLIFNEQIQYLTHEVLKRLKPRQSGEHDELPAIF